MPAGLAGSRPTASGWIYVGAYARSPQGLNLELFRVRADGTDRHRLTRNGSADFSADVSPDGRRVVFVRYMSGTVDGLSQDGAGFNTLWLMNANGTGLKKLLGARELPSEWPRWSPDGRWIAFQSQCGFGSTGGHDNTCLYLSVIRPDASGERRLTRSFFRGSSRASFGSGLAWTWSPDGRTIAFERPRDESGDASVVALVEVATGVESVVGEGRGPAFGPRREILALSKGRRIAIIRTTGEHVRWVSTPPREWSDVAPSWSPDGSRIAFWRVRSDGETFRLVVVGPGALTRSFAIESPIVRRIPWSPDGTQLVASLWPGDTAQVVRLDVRSGTRERIGAGFAEAWERAPR